MSRSPLTKVQTRAGQSGIILAAVVSLTGLLPAALAAQSAMGVPFIGPNNLSLYSAELSRSGGSEMTRLFGVAYAHRFRAADRATHVTMELRVIARPFDDASAGVLDAAALLGVSYDLPAVPGLSLAASTGTDAMAWGDDVANTGRLHLVMPANLGASYEFHLTGITIAPFVMGTVARYQLRTYLNDLRQTTDRGWDVSYTTGASLHLKEVVVSTRRIVGEYGMPNKSRWAFSAGLSF